MPTALRVNPSQTWTGTSGPPGKLAWFLRSPVHCRPHLLLQRGGNGKEGEAE